MARDTSGATMRRRDDDDDGHFISKRARRQRLDARHTARADGVPPLARSALHIDAVMTFHGRDSQKEY